jgi:hypothetical protein
MTYKDKSGKVLSIESMNYFQKQVFWDDYFDRGFIEAHGEIISLELEDCDEKTKDFAMAAYKAGWMARVWKGGV